MGRGRKLPKDLGKRRWSITTKVEENIKCDVTIKVKDLLSCLRSVLLSLLFCPGTHFCRDFSVCLGNFPHACPFNLKNYTKLIFIFQLNHRQLHLNSNLRSIATGSWGCGERNAGDPQFKVLIQWLAASVANVPSLIYYTCSRESLSKLDTVVRVLHGESRRISVVCFEILRKFLVFAPSFRSKMDCRGAT